MTDPTSSTDPDPGLSPDASEPLTGAPRWVKVVGLIAVIVLVVFGILMLTGGPEAHGPGRHGGGPSQPVALSEPPSAWQEGQLLPERSPCR